MQSDEVVAEALWRKVAEEVRAPAPHRAYLEHCLRAGLLAEAARRYRAARDALGEEETELRALIDERLEAIALLAIAELEARRAPPPGPRSSRWLLVLATIVLLASGGLLVWALL